MHGRKKVAGGPSKEEREERAKKIVMYKQLVGAALKQRHNNVNSTEAMFLNAKILAASPDVATLWNHRREYLIEQSEACTEFDPLHSLVEGELKLTRDAIQKNPKSYSAWHHRQWVIDRWIDSEVRSDEGKKLIDADMEITLCDLMLSRDERNFHCWNYRRWVLQRANLCLNKELEYTKQKIATNISNYSAWHQRSYLLPLVYGIPVTSTATDLPFSIPKTLLPLPILIEELVLLHNALFTEPDDQSPWIYRRWVIENVISWCEIVYATTLAANNGAEGAAISFGMPSTPIEKDDNANPSLYLASLALSALLYDKNQIQLLYSVSSDSKWVLEALAHLTRRMEAKCYLEIYRQSPYFAVAEAETSAAPEGNEKAAPPSPDARKLNIQSSDVAWLASLGDTPKEGDHTSSLYSKLATIDPLHKEYYAYQLAMRYV